MFQNPEEPKITATERKLVEYILCHNYDKEGHEK